MRDRILGIVVLLLLTAAPLAGQFESYTGPPENSQGWFTRDKRLHFGISAVGSAGIYALGVWTGLPRPPAAAISAVIVGAAGVWREVGTTDDSNRISRQNISRKDLVWDAVGIGVGLGLTELYYRLRSPRQEEQQRALPAPAPAQ